MLRAVERHVLEKVGETQLVVVFENGARVHHKAKFRPVLRLVIGPYVESEPVVEPAHPHLRVVGEPGAQRNSGRIGGLGMAGDRKTQEGHGSEDDRDDTRAGRHEDSLKPWARTPRRAGTEPDELNSWTPLL
jgi:hypothetical protein